MYNFVEENYGSNNEEENNNESDEELDSRRSAPSDRERAIFNIDFIPNEFSNGELEIHVGGIVFVIRKDQTSWWERALDNWLDLFYLSFFK